MSVIAPPAWSQSQSNPADGQQDVPTAFNFTWPQRANATAYYLYVGSRAGSKDVVDSGEIPVPAYRVTDLPSSTDLYATRWARVNGVWLNDRVSFRTSATASPSGVAALTSPGMDVEAIPQALEFAWNAVADASAYYLYVGSSSGANDILNSGELQSLSASVAGLPIDATVYVRLWTKLGTTWRYRDYQYLAVGNTTQLTHPVAGDQAVDPGSSFRWRKLLGAEKYYLYVGTAPGLRDVVNSGETTRTSWPNTPLAGATIYYVRMHTRMVGGKWASRDYVFRTDALAVLAQPVSESADVDPSPEFSWTPVENAQKYYLYVGSSPGAKDLVDSGETTALSLAPQPLPGGFEVHARMWTKVNDIWRYRDSAFSTRPAPRFVNPRSGQTGVDTATTLEWTEVAGISTYTLSIGTTPGGKDILADRQVSGTQTSVESLPQANALYARVTSGSGSTLGFGDVVFSTRPAAVAARLLRPANGTTLDAAASIRWYPAPLARTYQLQVGTAPDTWDLLDTGEIHVTERYVENLPAGIPLYALLTTHFIKGAPHGVKFTFTRMPGELTFEQRLDQAKTATGAVRNQASGKLPATNSLLASEVRLAKRQFALCDDYSSALRKYIAQLDLGLTTRTRYTCIGASPHDCHTLVEALNELTQEWIILDPTFGLAARRNAGQAHASATDISQATHEQRWADIEYEALTSRGFGYAQDYYVDYPLLFMNLFDRERRSYSSSSASILGFFDRVAAPIASSRRIYSLGCAEGRSTVRAIVDSSERTLECAGYDNLTAMFLASSISAAPGDEDRPLTIFTPHRHVFIRP